MHDTHNPGQPKCQLITRGQFVASAETDMVIQTLLGSCVSVCLWDEPSGVGGMNHLLLAGERRENGSGHDVAGVAEMECLINGIIKLGGQRERLQAKVFGGAKMLDCRTAIGDNNARFAFEFLRRERIPCVNSSVGGKSARAVRFWPVTGRVIMRFVRDAPVDARLPKITPQFGGNGLELY